LSEGFDISSRTRHQAMVSANVETLCLSETLRGRCRNNIILIMVFLGGG